MKFMVWKAKSGENPVSKFVANLLFCSVVVNIYYKVRKLKSFNK